jgi:CRP-like cAMP-binding protein
MGIVGVILYIGSYFALQAGKIKGQGYLYAGLNTAAACCVLLSLTKNFNLSSAIIQVTYISISVFGIVRFYLLTNRIRFTDEERVFLEVVAPNLAKLQARQLLDLGTWKTAQLGTLLTEEGKSLARLSFLFDGAADVTVAGGTVAKLGPKSLIGEMSCLTGMQTSATVTVTEPSRLFTVEVKKLNDFLARNLSVRHELESRFAYQIGEKLIRANTALSVKT